MLIEVHNRCSDFDSYRAMRTKSLYNAESGCNFDLVADLPIDDRDWKLGLVVGPSGSGKTSIGRIIFGPEGLYEPAGWPADRPIVEAIAAGGSYDEVTAALSAVGLGDVHAWLRPYPVLSNGEKFRADLSRIICDAPARIVVDEFTSVVDRQIAKVGALAFQKAWRRTKGQCVLLSCHYDIVDWLEPDWVFDTATGKYAGRGLWRRPKIGALCYVGTVNGELVAHLAVGTASVGRTGVEARACRMVVMPEWQGAGVGLRFLNACCQLQLDGAGRIKGRRLTTIFHTSHPGLCAALRRDPKWAQVSAVLHGVNKLRSSASIRRSHMAVDGRTDGRTEQDRGRLRRTHASGPGLSVPRPSAMINEGWGGHFRAVQGFRFLGAR